MQIDLFREEIGKLVDLVEVEYTAVTEHVAQKIMSAADGDKALALLGDLRQKLQEAFTS